MCSTKSCCKTLKQALVGRQPIYFTVFIVLFIFFCSSDVFCVCFFKTGKAEDLFCCAVNSALDTVHCSSLEVTEYYSSALFILSVKIIEISTMDT